MSALGAILGLVLAIGLILKKVSPFYALMLGAIVGGLLGGFGIAESINLMVSGVKDVSPAILRILSAGVLTGCLIKTGAAETIAHRLIGFLGQKHILAAICLTTFLLTAIGVFIDVAVITCAPIALNIGRNLKLPKAPLLLMMIGGGKCGNIISPNPNTIVAAENLGADLTEVMMANLLPALGGLFFVIFLLPILFPKGDIQVSDDEVNTEDKELPGLLSSIAAPLAAIVLLALRPIASIVIDPLIALPVAGLVGVIATNKISKLNEGLQYGLTRMSGIAILLIGTGAIAGIIKASSLKDVLLNVLEELSLSAHVLAPLSGILMSAATASTTAGATIASATFGDILANAGVAAVAGAAMINAGATTLDHLPHGSFFHASGGVMNFDIKQRLRLMPYETMVGLVLSVLSFLWC